MSNVRNEVEIELAGETRVMRATFAAIRGIERDLNTNVVPLIEKLAKGDIGVAQAAVIVFHGLHGNKDTRLNLEKVGEAIMDAGLSQVMEPVVKFISCALEGVKMGKPEPETA
jgi:hypothetical protein